MIELGFALSRLLLHQRDPERDRAKEWKGKVKVRSSPTLL